MAYADQLYEVVDRFFMQIVMPYGVKNGVSKKIHTF